jgi:hypothetical protein
MQPIEIQKLLDEALKASGSEQVAAALQNLATRAMRDDEVLTIIANAGVHEIPQRYLRGEVYEASRGNWNATTEEALILELTSILSRLVDKLRSGHWKCVYLIPTGHPILSLQIKAMVYRLLRINTIDLYHKEGAYFEINLDQRAVALDAGNRA